MTAVAEMLGKVYALNLRGFFPPGAMLLVVAAVLLYAVARSMVDLLARDATGPSAARLATALATPVVAVAMWAAWFGQAGMALGVVLGAALAALALVTGISLANADRPVDELPPGSRSLQFLLPVMLVLLVIGFGAHIGLTEAALLALLGLVILGVWNEDARRTPTPATIAAPDLVEPNKIIPIETGVSDLADSTRASPVRDRLRPVRWVLTIVLAVAGGWLATRAGIEVGTSRRMLSPGVVGVTLLSAIVSLPAVGIGTFLARTNRVGVAVSTHSATALILVTAALPLTVVVWHLRKELSPIEASTSPAIAPATQTVVGATPTDVFTAMPFGIGLWRIETLLLVALSLPLVPIATGRLKPGRLEGAVLMAGYVFYLLVVVALGDRWH